MIKAQSPFTDEQLMGIVNNLFGFEPNLFYIRFAPMPRRRLISMAVSFAFARSEIEQV